VKGITSDITWVGVNDRRLAMFEGVYSVPKGVSYNSYFLDDEKKVLFDTVDKVCVSKFLENVDFVLKGKSLDYLVIQHVEPDHSFAIENILNKYKDAKLVCSSKILNLINQFFNIDLKDKVVLVNEGDTLKTGRHTLNFIMAPMVHWPEVMVTYDSYDKVLFSADAFGCFGALNGVMFADEVDICKDYMDEYRRYYANIVGKYGTQVSSLLKKTIGVDIRYLCPLHGFVWRNNIHCIIEKYELWSVYEPEVKGVMIVYASVYGNTETVAELVASKLNDLKVETIMYDVSVTHSSEIVASAFKYSHIIFASTTYNAGIFIAMEDLINDLVAHNIQNKTIGIIENGSWAATSAYLIQEKLSKCKEMRFLETKISIKSSIKKEQLIYIDRIATEIVASFRIEKKNVDVKINNEVMKKIQYGLFVLGVKNNACIINTVMQISSDPYRVSIIVNKSNYTHDILVKTKKFNVSILNESAGFEIFERFGFHSGKDSNKFEGCDYVDYSSNGIVYLNRYCSGVISGKIIKVIDSDTHSLFIADVENVINLSDENSVSYKYYFDHIKPKKKLEKENKKGYVCKICGYVYEADEIPNDYICPLCKHGIDDFEKI